ncbi:hypothetical protein E2C01_079910 [Portunus trituberculatus]|uniref:Uncharacterized protein n=1 Tax=Portunus trituberculatus TaxID=210409 RepID=A0A5B7IWV4_PORTR|nr:hypothetical protein [Portunus trituberculatus]
MLVRGVAGSIMSYHHLPSQPLTPIHRKQMNVSTCSPDICNNPTPSDASVTRGTLAAKASLLKCHFIALSNNQNKNFIED